MAPESHLRVPAHNMRDLSVNCACATMFICRGLQTHLRTHAQYLASTRTEEQQNTNLSVCTHIAAMPAIAQVRAGCADVTDRKTG